MVRGNGNMLKKKIVSIVIVSFNQEQFISAAFKSVLMQRLPTGMCAHIVVADDKSTDNTLLKIKEIEQEWRNSEECEGLLPEDTPIQYLDAPSNLGMSQNYHRAFKNCEGEYIALLEGDDYWSSPYHLQQHIIFLDRHRECSMSMNNLTYHFYEKGEFLLQEWMYKDEPHYVSTKEQISQGNQLGNLSACVLRNKCVKELPDDFYQLGFADWMLGVMLSQQGLLGLLKESTSVYRINMNGRWASKSDKEKCDTLLKCIDKYNGYQDGKYNVYWEAYKRKVLRMRKARPSDYLPPFLKSIIKACIPPILR